MAVCQIPLRERSRRSLGKVLALVNLICCGLGYSLLFLAFYLKIALGTNDQLLSNYDPTVLFRMLLGMSGTLTVCHIIGAKMCYDCGNWRTRDRFHAFFIFWVISSYLLTLGPFTGCILCAIHKGLIEIAFTEGFARAAVRYKTDPPVKEQLDRLQIALGCCGAVGKDDWSRISWVQMDYAKPSKEFSRSQYRDPEGELVFPWPPWSCCNSSTLAVCDTIWEMIPHNIHQRSKRSAETTNSEEKRLLNEKKKTLPHKGRGTKKKSWFTDPFKKYLSELRLETSEADSMSKLDNLFHAVSASRQATSERTFNQVGCGEALARTVAKVVDMAMWIMFFCWIFQTLQLLMARWLQTSMDLAYKWGNPKMMAPGYLLKKIPCCGEEPPEMKPPDAALYEEQIEQSSDDEK